jgi:DNA-binding NarL/FixJ family response regulator
VHHQSFRDPGAEKCRVLVVASDHRMRASLRALVQADGRYSVVADACTVAEAIELDRSLRPALILLDLLFPTAIDGLDAVRLLALGSRRPIVVLSVQAALRDAAYAAGATGFVVQGDDADALLAVISAAMVQPPFEP